MHAASGIHRAAGPHLPYENQSRTTASPTYALYPLQLAHNSGILFCEIFICEDQYYHYIRNKDVDAR